jgi:alpha-L-fucosidase 2
MPETGTVQGYRRALDIDGAVATVEYAVDGVQHRREHFVSYPHRVIVVRHSGSGNGEVGFTASVKLPANRTAEQTAQGGRITVAGVLHDNGLRFECQVHIATEGGVLTDNADGSVTVSGADSATILIAAGTDYSDQYPTYRGPDPHQRVTDALDGARRIPYAEIREAHQRDHRALFRRVRLDIAQQTPDLPTDRHLAAYQGGGSSADRALEALFFQYGRYLLIASSRDGDLLPANLQGVWNASEQAPWSADYHTNINVQMNYWPAGATNLSDTTGPLFAFVEALRPPGGRTAKEMFGSPGWVVHDETNPFGFTGVHDWPTAFWFPEAAAWLVHHLYDHYRFTLDHEFLAKRAYPIMREVADFWLAELVVDPRDGTLVVSPSFSPEHGEFTAGASMSQQIVWDLFTNVVEAAAIVGEESADVAAALERLDPGTRIGSWGQLQEWKGDWDDPTDEHRHASHLFGLHPGRQISPRATPAYAHAAKVSLNGRGDGGTGWSKAWKINFWARLLDGDHAHLMLSELLKTSTLANLWDTHPPFQIDGNFGATAGIAEMLIQSHAGKEHASKEDAGKEHIGKEDAGKEDVSTEDRGTENRSTENRSTENGDTENTGSQVHILPALPAAWPHGRVTGLRARGDLTVDIAWAAGQAREIALTAGHDGRVGVRAASLASGFRLVEAISGRTVQAVRQDDQVTFDARPGVRYLLSPSRTGLSPA